MLVLKALGVIFFLIAYPIIAIHVHIQDAKLNREVAKRVRLKNVERDRRIAEHMAKYRKKKSTFRNCLEAAFANK